VVLSVDQIPATAEFFITDPPYADAVHYHEITEFFIAWLRKNPPPPFDQWTWDSRRDWPSKAPATTSAAAWSMPTKR
jgi:hypothetical protein